LYFVDSLPRTGTGKLPHERLKTFAEQFQHSKTESLKDRPCDMR
jgi:acyl-coenzyme A synthetase/AMP-(fatty) acid ligase